MVVRRPKSAFMGSYFGDYGGRGNARHRRHHCPCRYPADEQPHSFSVAMTIHVTISFSTDVRVTLTRRRSNRVSSVPAQAQSSAASGSPTARSCTPSGSPRTCTTSVSSRSCRSRPSWEENHADLPSENTRVEDHFTSAGRSPGREESQWVIVGALTALAILPLVRVQ